MVCKFNLVFTLFWKSFFFLEDSPRDVFSICKWRIISLLLQFDCFQEWCSKICTLGSWSQLHKHVCFVRSITYCHAAWLHVFKSSFRVLFCVSILFCDCCNILFLCPKCDLTFGYAGLYRSYSQYFANTKHMFFRLLQVGLPFLLRTRCPGQRVLDDMQAEEHDLCLLRCSLTFLIDMLKVN